MFKHLLARLHQQHVSRYTRKLTKRLHLTETQQTQLRALQSELTQFRQHLGQWRQQLRSRFPEWLTPQDFNRSEAEQAFLNHMATIQTRIPPLASGFADFYAGLDTDQKQKLRSLFERRCGCHC